MEAQPVLAASGCKGSPLAQGSTARQRRQRSTGPCCRQRCCCVLLAQLLHQKLPGSGSSLWAGAPSIQLDGPRSSGCWLCKSLTQGGTLVALRASQPRSPSLPLDEGKHRQAHALTKVSPAACGVYIIYTLPCHGDSAACEQVVPMAPLATSPAAG
jgi:hypothetical protein